MGISESVTGIPVDAPSRAIIPVADRVGSPRLSGEDLPRVQFTIVVSYPGGERGTHDHAVYHGMPVEDLRRALSGLLRMDDLVSLTVGPIWLALDHCGAITDRLLPGSTTPCPFLEQSSEVQVLVPVFLAAPVDLLGPLDLVSNSGNRAVNTSHANEGELAPSLMAATMTDSTDWGSMSLVPISWGKADPPPHPDEGLEWSNTSDRADCVAWDLRRVESGSPPPKSLAPDLFSDRGDGYSLGHLRRKGENAESMTIDPEYVSSGSRAEERRPIKNGKEEATLNGEHGSSSIGEQEGSAVRPRHLRESRKAPFSPSPPPRDSPPNSRSLYSFPRQYSFDEGHEEFDAILERQRLADQSLPEEDKSAPKRKREVLSDRDYQQRKERTDNLVEELRNVRERYRLKGLQDDRERTFLPMRESSPVGQVQRGAEEKGELCVHPQLKDDSDSSEREFTPADVRRAVFQRQIDVMNTTPDDEGWSPYEKIHGKSTIGGRPGGNNTKVLREEIAELMGEIHRDRSTRSTKENEE